MNDFATTHAARRGARRVLGADDAQEGVHFLLVRDDRGRMHFRLIPGPALDALAAQVAAKAKAAAAARGAAR